MEIRNLLPSRCSVLRKGAIIWGPAHPCCCCMADSAPSVCEGVLRVLRALGRDSPGGRAGGVAEAEQRLAPCA